MSWRPQETSDPCRSSSMRPRPRCLRAKARMAAAAEAEREAKQRIADSVIGSTLAFGEPCDLTRYSARARTLSSVQIKEVVRRGNSLYVRFAVTNTGTHPYRSHFAQCVHDRSEQKRATGRSIDETVRSRRRRPLSSSHTRPRRSWCGVQRSRSRMSRQGRRWKVCWRWIVLRINLPVSTSSSLAMMALIEFRPRRCCDARIRNDHTRGGACAPPRCLSGSRATATFLETLRRPFLNPVEQRDDKGTTQESILAGCRVLFSRRSPGSA